jgi:transposase
MFCLNDTMRYFLCPGKTDMRKGINSLCGVVHEKMGYDVRLGDEFIFVNRNRNTMKLLHAEDGGLVLYLKRLEEGTFRLPTYDAKNRSYPMEWRDLVMMVEGMQDNSNERLMTKPLLLYANMNPKQRWDGATANSLGLSHIYL